MLSLNNLVNLFTDVPSIVVTKCVILNDLSHMTKIISFSTTNGNFMIKSTIRCIYSFSRTLFAIIFSIKDSIQFFIL